MSSRREEKERLRQERLANEQAATEAGARRRRLLIGGGAAAAIAVVAVVIILAVSGGGGGAKTTSSTAAASSGAAAGLQAAPAPWAPEYAALATRLRALKFPGQSDAGFHIHAMLRVYVDGKQVTVPANVGIDPQGRFIAPLHTHDTTGVIHMEATQPYPFTLGQFFTVWGVKFAPGQLGAYRTGGGNTVAVYVNGKPVANPAAYVLKAHDAVVVAYGKPGSFPSKYTPSFAPGL